LIKYVRWAKTEIEIYLSIYSEYEIHLYTTYLRQAGSHTRIISGENVLCIALTAPKEGIACTSCFDKVIFDSEGSAKTT